MSQKSIARVRDARSEVRVRDARSEQPIGITPSSVRRIARRAGILKMNSDVYEEMMLRYDAFVGTLVHEMCVNAKHARNEEVSEADARASLRERGLAPVYG